MNQNDNSKIRCLSCGSMVSPVNGICPICGMIVQKAAFTDAPQAVPVRETVPMDIPKEEPVSKTVPLEIPNEEPRPVPEKTEEPRVEAPDPQNSSAQDDLKSLLDSGLISKEEYDRISSRLQGSSKAQSPVKEEIKPAPKADTWDGWDLDEEVKAPAKKNDDRPQRNEVREVKPKEKKKKNGLVIFLIILLLILAAAAVAVFTVPKLKCMVFGHTPASRWVTTKNSTCTEMGEEVLRCSVCGETIQSKSLPKIDHNYINGVCTRCGAKDPYYVISPIHRAMTIVELHVRTGPGLSYSVLRNLPYGTYVDIYEVKYADGYSWNRINSGEWVADDGTFLYYLY